MAAIDYTKTDAALTDQIRGGRSPYNVRPEIDFRIIERRLQALRKAGKIVADRKATGGWRITEN